MTDNSTAEIETQVLEEEITSEQPQQNKTLTFPNPKGKIEIRVNCYLLMVSGDPEFRLNGDQARKDGIKAEFLPEGWVYEKQEDADAVAERFTLGNRKLKVIPWLNSEVKDIWHGTESTRKLARKRISQEFKRDKTNKEKKKIEAQCNSSGLHPSWLYREDLPDGMSKNEIEAYKRFKPLWDKCREENEIIKLREHDLRCAEEDAEQKARRNPIFQPYTFSELQNMPPKEWLVDQFFGEGDLGMVYGPPGCGKTFIVIDMIVSICSKIPVANKFNVNRELNVAYCAGEGISGLPSRFIAAAQYHEAQNLHNLTFYKTMPQLYESGNNDTKDLTAIDNFILEWKKRIMEKEAGKLDVLVIDTLHTASVTADENSARDMGKVLQSCRLAANELGCAVILVHHTNKSGTGERGSSALRGAMDFMIEIKKQSDTETRAIMSCSKLKDGEQWQDQGFDLCAVEGTGSVRVSWFSNDDINGQPRKTAADKDKESLLLVMRQHRGTKFTSKSLSERIGKGQTYANKLLSDLVRENKCYQRLQDPEKDASRWNPWVYLVENFQRQDGDI